MNQTIAKLRYSPLAGAVGSSIWVAAMLLAIAGLSGKGESWYWSIVGLPIIALVVHLGSARVLYVHLVGLLSLSLIVVTTGGLLCQLVARELGLVPLFAGTVLAALVAVLVAIGVVRDRNSALRAQLPCGWDGRLDERTGIVDPNAESPAPQSGGTRTNKTRIVLVLLSMAVLSQILLPAVSPATKTIILILSLSWLLGAMSQKVGRMLSMIETTIRWEREHGKKIRVLRGRRTT